MGSMAKCGFFSQRGHFKIFGNIFKVISACCSTLLLDSRIDNGDFCVISLTFTF